MEKAINSRLWAGAGVIAVASMLACASEDVPERPTWVDVEPILNAQCTHCHGSSAAQTGGGYRFDFFDMSADVCGPAARALGTLPVLGKDLAPQIADAITSVRSDIRPSMPPLPAPYLEEREWKTILRWAADPQRGVRDQANRPPRILLDGTAASADRVLPITAVVDDPDGDSVVGVLTIGDHELRMDRSGAFSARIDSSSWPVGPMDVSAVLCDGWSSVSYFRLGVIEIDHGP